MDTLGPPKGHDFTIGPTNREIMLIVREGHTCDACGIPINILHASHVCPSLTISIELLVGEVAIAEQPGGPAAGWQMLIVADVSHL